MATPNRPEIAAESLPKEATKLFGHQPTPAELDRLTCFNSLTQRQMAQSILTAAKENRRFESGVDTTGFIYITQLEEIVIGICTPREPVTR